ncbi:MAG: TonB-dependent receptor [Gemmatimonadales bacterium]|nr:TonB-dependent receptor [Gemmatimonadales bacterium]
MKGVWWSALLWAGLALGSLEAQSIVAGVVRSKGLPVEGAGVSIGTTRVVTDATGRFRLTVLVSGPVSLRVAAIGYKSTVRSLTIGTATDALVIELEENARELDPVVVTGTRRETRLSESPVKVEVVSARFLERNLTNNLMESLQTLTGISQQIDCGVCYTNSIRINGMEGPYTAVLIDGAPIMSSLATVYGLNGIHPALVEQVEIIRGPASTLYGSEAMGGVINVITKDPRFAPRSSLTLSASTDRELSTDFAVSSHRGEVRTLLSGSVAHNRYRFDRNADGFTDIPVMSRIALFNKWSFGPASYRKADLAAKLYFEDRFGGQLDWARRDRGGSRIYGEQVDTRRVELIGAVHPALLGQGLRFDWSGSWHDQDSYYGTMPYRASQLTGFGQLQYARAVGEQANLVAGAGVRYLRYDDETPATLEADVRVVPGVFAQLEQPLGNVTLLGGLRVDRHGAHGLILSPRASAKLDLGDASALRLNLATGFRVVNLFTEDHAALTGARTVVIAEQLDPERSATGTLSATHTAAVGDYAVTLDLDAFYTRFSNRILPDYDSDPDLILYRNLRGHAVTRGISATVTFAPGEVFPLSFKLGGTAMDAFEENERVRSDLVFAPSFKGEATVSGEIAPIRLTLDWTARLVGPMALPSFPDRPDRSPWYSEHNVQLTRAVGLNSFLLFGIRNLLGYRQPSPLVRPDDPFGPDFDTSYVYGPIQGRRAWMAVQWNVPR